VHGVLLVKGFQPDPGSGTKAPRPEETAFAIEEAKRVPLLDRFWKIDPGRALQGARCRGLEAMAPVFDRKNAALRSFGCETKAQTPEKGRMGKGVFASAGARAQESE
jgi:hypothetical protein